MTLGDEVELRPGDVAVGGEAALFKRGFWLKAMAWRAEVEALRARGRRDAPERAPSVQRSGTPRQRDVGGGERLGRAGANDDARTLWIDWDSQGERYKPEADSVPGAPLDYAGVGLGERAQPCT